MIIRLGIFFAVFFSSASIADVPVNEGALQELEETLDQFPFCHEEEVNDDFSHFEKLFSSLKQDFKNKGASSIVITDFNFDNVTLKNYSSLQECTLFIDIYDGRCVYALCK